MTGFFLLLGFAYWHEEVYKQEKELKRRKEAVLFNAEEFKDFNRFENSETKISKIDDKFWLENDLLVDEAKFQAYLEQFSHLKIKRGFKGKDLSEIKNIFKSSAGWPSVKFFSGGEVIKIELGPKLEFDQDFYLRVTRDKSED